MKTNYHTHTTRCKHAIGLDEDYVVAAIEAGIEILGYSDHSPWPLHEFESGYIRMALDELPDYLHSIRSLKAKYQDKIEILVGLECEYFADRIKWLKQLKHDEKLDYLVFGNHYHKYDRSGYFYGNYHSDPLHLLRDYLDDTHAALKTGIYDLFAHPDVFLRGWGKFDEAAQAASHQICQWAKQYDVPLEYNLNGLRANASYPNLDFFRIVAQHGNPVIISYDAHDPQFLKDEVIYQRSYQTLIDLGCHVIDKLPLRNHHQ